MNGRAKPKEAKQILKKAQANHDEAELTLPVFKRIYTEEIKPLIESDEFYLHPTKGKVAQVQFFLTLCIMQAELETTHVGKLPTSLTYIHVKSVALQTGKFLELLFDKSALQHVYDEASKAGVAKKNMEPALAVKYHAVNLINTLYEKLTTHTLSELTARRKKPIVYEGIRTDSVAKAKHLLQQIIAEQLIKKGSTKKTNDELVAYSKTILWEKIAASTDPENRSIFCASDYYINQKAFKTPADAEKIAKHLRTINEELRIGIKVLPIGSQYRIWVPARMLEREVLAREAKTADLPKEAADAKNTTVSASVLAQSMQSALNVSVSVPTSAAAFRTPISSLDNTFHQHFQSAPSSAVATKAKNSTSNSSPPDYKKQ